VSPSAKIRNMAVTTLTLSANSVALSRCGSVMATPTTVIRVIGKLAEIKSKTARVKENVHWAVNILLMEASMPLGVDFVVALL
jgi:hypothetical protein